MDVSNGTNTLFFRIKNNYILKKLKIVSGNKLSNHSKKTVPVDYFYSK